MKRARDRHRSRFAAGALLAGVLGCVGGTAEAGPAGGSRGPLYAELSASVPRFGLVAERAVLLVEGEDGEVRDEGGEGKSISPILAGFLSGVIPGSGQLVMGQRRGWLYLGIEGTAWFSYFALRSAGNQSETDYHEYADLHWDWTRYETVTQCGNNGPNNFDEERALLQDWYDHDRDKFYQEIGDQSVYACGWETQGQRSDYHGMLDHADALFRGSGLAVGAALLNHLVSAVDAARSASGRRRAEGLGSLRWDVKPTATGPALSVAMNRSF